MIHIAFNLDNAYVPHCAAVMVSVCKNHSDSGDIYFHLLGLDVNHENKCLLNFIVKEFGCGLSFYDIDGEDVIHLPNLTRNHHVTAATYIRLFLPKYLPQDVEKVIYLDGDLIVRHDIRELWDIDIAGYALAAVEDVPIFEHQQRLGLKKNVAYFNAGVMVIQLNYWRQCSANKRFRECLEQQKEKILFHDQDVLNMVFADEKIIISPNWNLMDVLYTSPGSIPPGYMATVREYMHNPAIVHFAGGLKPWDCRLHNPFQKDYFYYLDCTPWKGMRPTFRSVVTKRGWLRALVNQIGIEYYLKQLMSGRIIQTLRDERKGMKEKLNRNDVSI